MFIPNGSIRIDLCELIGNDVQPVPGVTGGHQCVTAKGSPSRYWIEAPGRTIQVEPETDGANWAAIFAQLLAAAAR